MLSGKKFFTLVFLSDNFDIFSSAESVGATFLPKLIFVRELWPFLGEDLKFPTAYHTYKLVFENKD